MTRGRGGYQPPAASWSDHVCVGRDDSARQTTPQGCCRGGYHPPAAPHFSQALLFVYHGTTFQSCHSEAKPKHLYSPSPDVSRKDGGNGSFAALRMTRGRGGYQPPAASWSDHVCVGRDDSARQTTPQGCCRGGYHPPAAPHFSQALLFVYHGTTFQSCHSEAKPKHPYPRPLAPEGALSTSALPHKERPSGLAAPARRGVSSYFRFLSRR